MERFSRSDLACENTRGVLSADEKRKVGPFTVQTLHTKNDGTSVGGEDERGRCVTVECGKITMLDDDAREMLVRLIAGELRGMCERLTHRRPDSDFCVFVAGIGNAALTADAIGPQTVGRLNVTRHLREHESGLYHSIGCSAVCALAPGVLGQTGIETSEILKSAVKCVRPHAVIVVDALAARSCDRLASTVQISDTGIAPGSGVGNHRRAVNEQTLGVPVIAIGVPTVVDSSTLVYDALRKANIREIDGELLKVLEEGESFFVSPKESDLITEQISGILARAIDVAFAEALSG